MIICDTSGLYAAYTAKRPGHEQTTAALNKVPGPLVVSSYVLAELDCLLRTKVSVEAEVAMLSDGHAGAYETTELTAPVIAPAISVIERYANRNLGVADAANVVLAARFKTTYLLTLDERDYRIIRPLWGDAFTLLPAYTL